MYSDDEKIKLMNELKDMESLKVDVGSEGEILQNELTDYFINSNGDGDDLIFRIELYFYAFKLFSRRSVRIDRNEFIFYLNDSLLDFEKIQLLKKDFDKFELEIESVVEKNDAFINLNFTLHY